MVTKQSTNTKHVKTNTIISFRESFQSHFRAELETLTGSTAAASYKERTT